jgi:O-antigen/teichoic acid export membrane protein
LALSEEPKESQNLVSRSLSALKWNYAGVGLRIVCQMAIGVILARMLGPGPFGTVAVAMVVVSACNLIADFGFGAALVQQSTLIARDVHFVFTCQLAVGAFMTSAGVLLADQVAMFFRVSEDIAPIRAMFLLFVLQSLGQTSAALLRRSLDFRYFQQVSIASYLIGYLLVGVPTAALGFGVWALVAANLVQVTAASIGYVGRARAQLGWALRPESKGIFAFGGKVVAANMSSWAISNLGSLAVGRMLGVVELGLYSRALSLVSTPTSALVSGLQGVLFSACSRAQNRPDQLRSAFLGASAAIAILCLPPLWAIAGVAETVVVGLYGGEWAAATGALQAFALAMPAFALLAVAGPVLMSIDKVSKELKAQGITLIVMLPLLAVAASHSMTSVAWAMLLVSAVRWALLSRAVMSALSIRPKELVTALGGPVVLAFGVTAAVWGSDHALRAIGLDAPARLAVLVAVGSGALLIGLRITGQRLLRDDLGQFLRSRGPLPAALSKLLNIKA